jgi:hypothetical protein
MLSVPQLDLSTVRPLMDNGVPSQVNASSAVDSDGRSATIALSFNWLPEIEATNRFKVAVLSLPPKTLIVSMCSRILFKNSRVNLMRVPGVVGDGTQGIKLLGTEMSEKLIPIPLGAK